MKKRASANIILFLIIIIILATGVFFLVKNFSSNPSTSNTSEINISNPNNLAEISSINNSNFSQSNNSSVNGSTSPRNHGGGGGSGSGSNEVPTCTDTDWTFVITPITCPESKNQTKSWSKIGQCIGGVEHNNSETISCNPQEIICTSFTYSDWSICGPSSTQSRNILTSSPSSCSGGNPIISQTCNYVPTPTLVTDISTIFNTATADLIRNFWLGDSSTGHIAPTGSEGSGIVGQQLADPRGDIWQSSTYANILYGQYKANPTQENKQRIIAQWNYLKSSFSATELTTCGVGRIWAIDDTGWNAAMYLQMYEITGDELALTYATNLVKCGFNQWKDSSGGLWYNNNHDNQCLVQIALDLDAIKIFQITNDQSMLQSALSSYNWMESHLLRDDGLYWMDYYNGPIGIDRPYDIWKIQRSQPGSVTSLFGNQGMAILQARLYAITGNESYKQKSIRSAQAVLDYLVDSNGVFINDRDAWANGHFMREWVQEVLPLSSAIQQKGFDILKNTTIAIYNYDRTSNGFYGGDWSGPVDISKSLWSIAGSLPTQIMVSSNTVDVIVATELISAPIDSGSIARDKQRKADLQKMQFALNKYYSEHHSYPTTNGNWYSSEQGDVGSYNNGDYIPGLSPSYISSLPRDPQGGAGKYSECSGWKSAYLYQSDGVNYKLLSHCAPESMVPSTNGFYDPGRSSWAYKVCSSEPACSTW